MTRKLWIPLVWAAGAALFATSFAVRAEVNSDGGYWSGPAQGEIWKNPFGLCWRASYWTPAMANAECDPDLMPKTVAAPPPPPPAPEPIAAPAPVPAPAPTPLPVVEKVTLSSDALFDFDKAVIRPAGKEKLDALADKIRGVDVQSIIVVGHTDRIGRPAYNMKLSQRRADAVKDYLASRGIEANRIQTEAKGETQPVTTCPDKMKSRKALIECLAPNRRVEIDIIGSRTQ